MNNLNYKNKNMDLDIPYIYGYANQDNSLHLFNAIVELQVAENCEHIVKELTEKLEKEFEIAETKGNVKKLYSMTYRADGLIKNGPVGKQIIATPWEYKPKSTKHTKTIASQINTNLIRYNLQTLQKWCPSPYHQVPLFIQQLRIATNFNVSMNHSIHNFAKKLQTLNAILNTEPEKRYIFESKKDIIVHLDKSFPAILDYTTQFFAIQKSKQHPTGYLNQDALEKLKKIITSERLSWSSHRDVIADLLFDNLTNYNINIENFNFKNNNRHTEIELAKLEDWWLLPHLQNIYETMYNDTYMYPIYERLGLIIDGYHPSLVTTDTIMEE